MFEMKDYIRCMEDIHAPERLRTEVLNMYESEKRAPGRRVGRRLLVLAAALSLVMALSAAAAAVSNVIYGWGGNLAVTVDSGGEKVGEATLRLDDAKEPVVIENGRMTFVVNDERIDITELAGESEAFFYEYVDELGVGHCWLVGKNGPEAENFGYAEFLYDPESREIIPELAGGRDWTGGFARNVSPDEENRRPEWFEKGKEKLGVPWS